MNQNKSYDRALWQAWIFDLDDTLLDTSQLLIPESLKRVLHYLKETKVIVNVDEELKIWKEKKENFSTFEIIKEIIERHGRSSDISIEEKIQESYKIFRTPSIPQKLPLRFGGKEILDHILFKIPNRTISLFLVTQGEIKTQIKKVEAMGIVEYFKRIYYVEPLSGESKEQCFREILNENKLTPDRVLSIGNRLDNEIAMSKKLGMRTCFVDYGEHRKFVPLLPEQVSDFKIENLNELIQFLKEG